MFSLKVIIHVKNDIDINVVSDALKLLGEASQKEKGCIRWEAHHSVNPHDTFILVETWETKQDWEEHLQQKAYKKYYSMEILPKITREVYFTNKLI